MSNPFLNNRFNVLDTNQLEKAKEKYVAPRGANNFTQPHKPDTNNGGPFRSQRRPVIAKLVAPTFNMEEHLFPNLSNNLSSQPQLTVTNETFKDIVNTVKQTSVDEQTIIKPGWVEVTGVKGKTCYNYRYGEKTEYQKNIEEWEEIETNPNYIMNTAINNIMKQRERHITEYNSIHGDGEYENKYIMSPCYGSEYDTDEGPDDGEDDGDEYDWH